MVLPMDWIKVGSLNKLIKLEKPTNLICDQSPKPAISSPVKLMTSAITIGINENTNKRRIAGNTNP